MHCIVYCAAVLCVENAFLFSFSDGMSRSGVFITCMSEIERVKVEGAVDIFQTVKAARAQRPHMVYTSVSDPTYSLHYACVHVLSRVRCVWQLPSGLLFDPMVYSDYDVMRVRDLFH